ncbi:MAG: lipopolysaccharide assembly protein LapA domain-containing protein [Deltaproteobacteria bacterium]|jgi:hypothetical protein|nr:lipopolysaccharide assembly protein LapA domain-containing protein [Deltaproteobacteria bacterium]
MRLIKIILLILFFVCSIVFFVQNTATLSQPMPLRFDPLPSFVDDAITASPFAWQSPGVPLYLVVLITFACGVFFSSLFFFLERLRSFFALTGKKRRIHSLERELAGLKADLAKAEQRLKDAQAQSESASAEALPSSGD